VEKEGLRMRLVPVSEYLQAMQADWDGRYNRYPGLVFSPGTILPQDYPGVSLTPTIAVPNGLVVRAEADPELVEFLTRALFEHRQDFEQAHWPDGGGRARAYPLALSVYESPLYCYVQLHPAAKPYYQEVLGAPQPCPSS
jgi:TRAP-type uncharacterized transport system substrate-binding protein